MVFTEKGEREKENLKEEIGREREKDSDCGRKDS